MDVIKKNKAGLLLVTADDYARIKAESESMEREQKGGAVLFEIGQDGKAIQVGWCHVQSCAVWADYPVTSPYSWVPGTFALADNGDMWQAVEGDSYNGAKKWEYVGVQA